MKGRRPRPKVLQLLKGKLSKREAAADDEPTPQKGLPPCPAYLPDAIRFRWAEVGGALDAMGVMTHADQWALALLCEAYVDWINCGEMIRREGAFYETKTQTGSLIRRPHPAVRMRTQAHDRVKSMLLEFGMTPVSRRRATKAEAAVVDPLEALRGRRLGGKAGRKET